MFNVSKKSKLGFVVLVLLSGAIYASHEPEEYSVLSDYALSRPGVTCDPNSGLVGIIEGGNGNSGSMLMPVLTGVAESPYRFSCTQAIWNLLKKTGSYVSGPKK